MQNINNKNAEIISKKLNDMLEYVYKKKPSISRHIDFNDLHIIYPKKKVYVLNIKYLKNTKTLLRYYFASIDKKPFTNRSYNIYAFEALWILLGIIDRLHGYKYRNKELFLDVTLLQNIQNTIQFGKYMFNIPKYKQFIFDVKGFNLAQLSVI